MPGFSNTRGASRRGRKALARRALCRSAPRPRADPCGREGFPAALGRLANMSTHPMSRLSNHPRSTTLLIRLKKDADGGAVLSATRSDGSVTWQRQTPQQAAFFVRHDLTHYAVETVLAHRRGFYGLIADGWTFDDFSAPRPRDRFPA